MAKPKAKRTNSASFQGELSVGVNEIEITEITGEEELTYDFLEILREFDGKHITIAIREEFSVDPIEE